MNWWDRQMVGFDLETTAPDPEEARIVTAAIAICGGGEETRTMTWLLNPGVEIPAEAAAIHGITTERARAEGDEAGAAIAEILTALSDMTPAGAPLVIFNGRYDLTVADREARRHGLRPLDVARFRVIDPLVCDKHLHRYRRGSRKLDAQAEHYGASLDGAHDASFDAVCACRVAWCIGKRGRVIRRVRHGGDAIELRKLEREWDEVRGDLGLLHDAQRRWAADQAASLEEYFRQGNPKKDLAPDPTAVVERAWPVIPFGGGQRPDPEPVTPEHAMTLLTPEWTT